MERILSEKLRGENTMNDFHSWKQEKNDAITEKIEDIKEDNIKEPTETMENDYKLLSDNLSSQILSVNKISIEINVMVLNKHLWPVHSARWQELPDELKKEAETFKHF